MLVYEYTCICGIANMPVSEEVLSEVAKKRSFHT